MGFHAFSGYFKKWFDLLEYCINLKLITTREFICQGQFEVNSFSRRGVLRCIHPFSGEKVSRRSYDISMHQVSFRPPEILSSAESPPDAAYRRVFTSRGVWASWHRKLSRLINNALEFARDSRPHSRLTSRSHGAINYFRTLLLSYVHTRRLNQKRRRSKLQNASYSKVSKCSRRNDVQIISSANRLASNYIRHFTQLSSRFSSMSRDFIRLFIHEFIQINWNYSDGFIHLFRWFHRIIWMNCLFNQFYEFLNYNSIIEEKIVMILWNNFKGFFLIVGWFSKKECTSAYLKSEGLLRYTYIIL